MLELLVRFILRVARSVEYHYNRYLRKKSVRSFLSTVCLEGRSHYPQEPRKSETQIKSELFQIMKDDKGAWTDDATLTQYFHFGCDRVSVDVETFVFQKEYDLARDALNGRLAPMYDYKHVAGLFLNACGVRASCAHGHISPDGLELCLRNGSRVAFEEWLKGNQVPIFCKPNDGSQGKECYRVEWNHEESCIYLNGEKRTRQEALNALGGLIVEPLILQHNDLREYSPNCVNPMRIRTICVDGEVRYVSTYICIAPADAYFSNVVRCGVAVGLDETGKCTTDGFCEMPEREGRYQVLPGTDIRLDTIIIPGVQEAIELAKEAHRATPQIFAMGWDVAVTDEGPIIIEGNSRYGTCTYQAVSGIGERAYYNQEFKSRLK